MSLINEATGTQGQMRSDLSAGLDVLDLNQTVVFNLYTRIVLPIDGFVFWVRANLNLPANQSITAQGSLHHTTTSRQDPDENFSVNRIVFTSKTEVNDLTAIAPGSMYIAEMDNGLRVAFSTRNMFYRQADLYHYSGDAVYPTLASQVIDNPATLLQGEAIVSNSLPYWLGFDKFFPIYPSLLVPDNIVPPYAVVHIGEDDTSPMQSGAYHDSTGTRWQLVKDRVRVTTYGVRNDMILDWLDYLQEYALGHPFEFGIMSTPVPRDAKKGQVEIGAIAQKKVLEFHVDYYQSRARDAARQLIETALLDFIVFNPA